MPSRAGSPNKNKQRLLKALQAEYGDNFNPIMEMAKNASRLQAIADTHYDEKTVDESEIQNSAVIAQTAWGKIAEYVAPKLKSIEISPGTDDDDNVLEWTINVIKAD